MALEEPQEGDVVLERAGVRIAVAGSFRIYFDNTILDYEDSAFSRGFVLKPGEGPSGEGEETPVERGDSGQESARAEVSSASARSKKETGSATSGWDTGGQLYLDGRSAVADVLRVSLADSNA